MSQAIFLWDSTAVIYNLAGYAKQVYKLPCKGVTDEANGINSSSSEEGNGLLGGWNQKFHGGCGILSEPCKFVEMWPLEMEKMLGWGSGMNLSGDGRNGLAGIHKPYHYRIFSELKVFQELYNTI